jgi:hypothetical protein
MATRSVKGSHIPTLEMSTLVLTQVMDVYTFDKIGRTCDQWWKGSRKRRVERLETWCGACAAKCNCCKMQDGSQRGLDDTTLGGIWQNGPGRGGPRLPRAHLH